ncbi:PTS sugar transporter subunit IIA [Lacrimispora sp.]|uniref:PTS sugar transporter subunit IIA n=1 Tax=Lacrimispora sp. TaxID=2719234 RepID=UPI00289D7B55|nr:PTS fructose transporter subunit IIA [Lacrimispora sp.]
MKYVMLVSHGELAGGMHSVIKMLAGEREDVLSTSLTSDMGAEQYAENVSRLIGGISSEDQIILFADIVGGSPLTGAMNVLDKKGLLDQTVIFGGMNLSMVLTVVMSQDGIPDETLKREIISSGQEAVKEFCAVPLVDDEI